MTACFKARILRVGDEEFALNFLREVLEGANSRLKRPKVWLKL